MEKNKIAIIGGGLAIILLIGVFYYFGTRNSQEIETSNNEGIILQTPTTTTSTGKNSPTSTAKTTTTTVTSKPRATKPANPLAPALEYQQALTSYRKSGYYIQFYPCQATPGSLVVKKGTQVMLDNRDKSSHVIGIGSKKYNIPAYNFEIATLSTVGTNYVTCDGGGRAVITVQP